MLSTALRTATPAAATRPATRTYAAAPSFGTLAPTLAASSGGQFPTHEQRQSERVTTVTAATTRGLAPLYRAFPTPACGRGYAKVAIRGACDGAAAFLSLGHPAREITQSRSWRYAPGCFYYPGQSSATFFYGRGELFGVDVTAAPAGSMYLCSRYDGTGGAGHPPLTTPATPHSTMSVVQHTASSSTLSTTAHVWVGPTPAAPTTSTSTTATVTVTPARAGATAATAAPVDPTAGGATPYADFAKVTPAHMQRAAQTPSAGFAGAAAETTDTNGGPNQIAHATVTSPYSQNTRGTAEPSSGSPGTSEAGVVAGVVAGVLCLLLCVVCAAVALKRRAGVAAARAQRTKTTFENPVYERSLTMLPPGESSGGRAMRGPGKRVTIDPASADDSEC